MVLMPLGVEVSEPFVILLWKDISGLKILPLVFVPEVGTGVGCSCYGYLIPGS